MSGEPLEILERHEAALAGLRTAIVDLEAMPSFLMLTNDELGPETVRKVGSAATHARQLWTVADATGGALAHVRDQAGLHGTRAEARAELLRLLTARWVSIELDRAVGPRAHAIPELLELLRSRYDEVRRWVTTVNDIWSSVLPRIDAARATLGRLEREVDVLGVPEPLIGRARALSDDLERRLVDDPLSVVAGDGTQLDAQVAAAATQVASLRAGYDNLEADLGATEELLASLRVLRATAEAAAAEARAKVVDPEGLVRVPGVAVLDGPGGLGERLDAVFARDEGPWSQRRALLDSWLTTARKLERQLERAGRVNRLPLEQRRELRGRLRAYQAKMSATGRAEDLELNSVIDRARAMLFTAPTDLDEAAATIDELARRLRS